MANLGNFNANEVEPNTSFDPLPAGKYLAAVTASEMKPTKKGDGSYLEVELTILEGEYKDRKVWDRLCLNNPNATAVKGNEVKLKDDTQVFVGATLPVEVLWEANKKSGAVHLFHVVSDADLKARR